MAEWGDGQKLASLQGVLGAFNSRPAHVSDERLTATWEEFDSVMQIVSEIDRLREEAEMTLKALQIIAGHPLPEAFESPWLQVYERHSHTGSSSYKEAIARLALRRLGVSEDG
jgi:hypothetical protein